VRTTGRLVLNIAERLPVLNHSDRAVARATVGHSTPRGRGEGLCVDISSIKCYMLSRIGHVIDLRIGNVNHHRIDKSRRVIKDLWVKL